MISSPKNRQAQVRAQTLQHSSQVSREMFMVALFSGGLFLTIFQALCLAERLF
jgi:hypothetical protein